MKMLSRISTGWNIQRALYLLSGVFVMVQALRYHDWMGVVLGSYFALMGLFALGCAGDMCLPDKRTDTDTNEFGYEEIKQK